MDYREIFKRVTAELKAERSKRQFYQERVKTLEAQLDQVRQVAGPAIDQALQELDRLENKINSSY